MNALLQSKIDLQRLDYVTQQRGKQNTKTMRQSNSEIECDFCNISSPDIKFRKGKSAYDDSFDTNPEILVNLLRQNKRLILKIVGRNDLIDGRHGHGHHDHLYNYNDDDDGERFSETHQNLTISTTIKLAGCSAMILMEISSRQMFHLLTLPIIYRKLLLKLNLPAAIWKCSKRAIAIRNKMIEIDSALENRIKVEESNANIACIKTISSVNDYHHILFIIY